MSKTFAQTYKDAGVDIEAGYKGVQLMKKHIQMTNIEGVVSDIGGFAGLFAPNVKDMEEPILVSGTDGVGTKVRIAQLLDEHRSIGIDAVAMCVNDILCCGAKPIFFLDYIAIGKNDPQKVADIVEGVANGCVQAGCALIGGETAEHPGIMKEDDYDIAGFAVGIVDKKDILRKENVKEGDVLIGISSSGVHANGFSLVRKVFDVENADLNQYVEEVGMPLGECLLTPTKIYVKPVLAVLEKCKIHGMSHITGGGFFENVPRCLPEGLAAYIDQDKIQTLPIFSYIQKLTQMDQNEMMNTFNMGIGMVLVVDKEDQEVVLETLKECGEDAYVIGEVGKAQEERVVLR